jgi:hypothetical protein
VCSVLELDASTIPGGYSFDRLRDSLAQRIRAIPNFREKLANSPQPRPPGVGGGRGLRDRTPPAPHRPAGPRRRIELAEICGHLASLPLDRRHPLWEMWVIEGVDGTDPPARAAGWRC